MTDPLAMISTSQAPWMVLCIFLILFIIKLQQDKLSQLCTAIGSITLALASHDQQAKNIQKDVDAIRQWCEDNGQK
jgi:hypothetical protein